MNVYSAASISEFKPFGLNPECRPNDKERKKVDDAIVIDGKPRALIDRKHSTEKLGPQNAQLLRYFHVSDASSPSYLLVGDEGDKYPCQEIPEYEQRCYATGR